MKTRRFFISLFFCFSLAFAFSQNSEPSDKVPDLLEGIWQGKDRLLMFSDKNEFAVVLRVFYQWYNDRAAEPASFSEITSRDRNDTSANPAENISVKFVVVSENPSRTAGVYNLYIKYPHEKEDFIIPVCVIDGNLYLDFLIKGSVLSGYDSSPAQESSGSLSSTASSGSSPDEAQNLESGFYRAASSANSISIAPPVFKNEVVSYFVNGNDIYKIRYWLSSMEYSEVQASFTDEDGETKVFSVDKFLKIGSNLYQCTTGRSTKIRNIEKSSSPKKKLTFDSDKFFVALGEPYLSRVPEKNGAEDLLSSVAENNKRRKPAPKPLFPPSEIDFHWKDISELEKYNPYTWSKRNLDIHK